VGNKKDLSAQRVVEMTTGAQFAQENGILIMFHYIDCLFLECSAFDGENIEEIFNKLTQTIIFKVENGEIA